MRARRDRSPKRMKTCLVLVLLLGGVVTTPPQAAAGFGAPGDILFSQWLPRGSGWDLDIFRVGIDGRNPINVTDRAWGQFHPDWSPDGRRFAMASGGEIHIASASGNRLRRVVQQTYQDDTWWIPEQARWSHDGQRLVYTMYEFEAAVDPDRRTSDWSGIGLARANGSLHTVLIHPVEGITHFDPTFFPDGSRILFTRYVQTEDSVVTADIFSMRTDGTDLTNLTDSAAGFDHRPAWTSDGRIMFVSRRGCQGATQVPCADIYSMRPDGTDVQQITSGPHDWGGDGFLDVINYVAPSPQGGQVLVRTTPRPALPGEGQALDLWLLDLDSGKRQLVVESFHGTFDWQPRCTVRGSRGDDVLVGTPARDLICGLGGNDTIYGLGADDVIFGHSGDDRIVGGAGRDIVVGNAGNDRCDADPADFSRVC